MKRKEETLRNPVDGKLNLNLGKNIEAYFTIETSGHTVDEVAKGIAPLWAAFKGLKNIPQPGKVYDDPSSRYLHGKDAFFYELKIEPTSSGQNVYNHFKVSKVPTRSYMLRHRKNWGVGYLDELERFRKFLKERSTLED